MKNRLNSFHNTAVIEPKRQINQLSVNQERNLLLQILAILNQQSPTLDIVREVLLKIKKHTGIEAVSIRLKDSDDFPYYETSGFSENFVKTEMSLCAVDKKGDIIRANNKNPYLECMCGKVISGKTNPELPFFTKYGSFWTNGTTLLISNISGNDLRIHIRNQCNKAGYESVALIPLKSTDEIIGLLQLNDLRQNMFSNDSIEFFEKLSHSIGIAVAHGQAEDTIKENEKKLIEAQKIAQLGHYVFDITSGTWTNSKELDVIFGIDDSYPKDIPSWLTLVHPEHREMMSSYLLYDILRQHNKFDKEYKILNFKTGEEKWVHGLGNLKFNKNREPIEIFGTIQEITKNKLSEKALHDSNIALKEILNKIEDEKKEQILSVQSHINRTVLPLLRKLRIGANDLQSRSLSLIINNLETVTSPFVSKIEARFVSLSPREIEICKMLKDGMNSKEIGHILCTSTGTVFNQRKTIRKKLDIANDNINLVAFLKSI